jgi:glucose-6-phosphate-specific signal transduction histidine kinase
MIVNLSLVDLTIVVAFSALVGIALGAALWRPTRRDRVRTERALALQEHMRQRAQQRLIEAARDEKRIDLEERARFAAAFFAPFEEHRRG